jgi:nicotinamidase-related amidase
VFGKEVPPKLYELVDPSASALVIIDMQNDCRAPFRGLDGTPKRGSRAGRSDKGVACRPMRITVRSWRRRGVGRARNMEP